MYTELTLLSRQAFDKATDEMVTIRDAVRYLEKELQTRSLRSKIDKFAKGRDEKALKELFISGLLADHPEMKKDSVERRVRGWLNPSSTHSLHKKDAIEAAFLLGLSLQEADDFVAMVSDEKLHWRSVEEIVYIFGLQNGLSWQEASKLSARMQEITASAEDTKVIHTKVRTSNIRPRVEALRTEEELEAFLREESSNLGYFHNQAYELFTGMLSRLQNPVSEKEADGLWGKREEVKIRRILRDYLFRDTIRQAKEREAEAKKKLDRDGLSPDSRFILSRIQKEISEACPDETLMSKMRARGIDVSRKVLILLFLATYRGPDSPDDEEDVWDHEGKHPDSYWEDPRWEVEIPEQDYTREEVFQDLMEHLNLMLSWCGYAPLDPRSPFDWLILYCICADDLLDMDDRLKAIFLEMFRE